MIIYGWNTKTIKQAPLPEYECPNCQQKQSSLVITAYYAHIFWIPLFPYKKGASIVCAHCKHQADEKAISLGSTVSVKQLKDAVPLPKYMFVGLVLIACGIGYLIYNSTQEEKQKVSFIQNPEVGDVYLIKMKDDTAKYNHYLMKVKEIHGDSLWISYSSFNYNGIVTQLDPRDGFYNIMYSMHKQGIQEYQDSGALIKVMRDYSTTSGFDREIEFQEADSVSAN